MAGGVAAAGIGALSQLVAGRLRVPSLAVTTTGIVPLLPGLTVYRGLFELVHGGGSGADCPLTLPTIVEWIVQWKLPAVPLNVADLLVPGSMLPKSTDPSSITTWCVVLSLFLNISVSPVFSCTGFG